MSIRILPKHIQGTGAFNGGQIIENKPIGFPRDGGHVRPYSSLFYWARAEALVDSTIGLHPHQGFEIMSFVLEGRIKHYDTAHQEWRPLEAGDVQIIRAGNGIQHSEHMERGAVIFQIWTDPDLNKTLQQEASYDDYPAKVFPTKTEGTFTVSTLIGTGSPLQMDTPGMTVTRVRGEGVLDLSPREGFVTSVYVLDGDAILDGQSVGKDDYLIIEDVTSAECTTHGPVDLFRIDSPIRPDYPLYAERLAHMGQH